MTKTTMPLPEKDQGFDFTSERKASLKIAAYVYSGKTLCPKCTRDLVVPIYQLTNSRASVESLLDEAAAKAGIDRAKEHTFANAEFPQVLYATDLIRGFDYCYVCLRDF